MSQIRLHLTKSFSMHFRFPYINLALFLLIFYATASAQKSRLVIQISNDRLKLNDTLDFVATYLLGEKKLPPATLALVMKENNGDGIWQMRWPMLNGHAEGSLIFPPDIKRGNYTLYFAVQARFFQVNGQVLYPPGVKKLTGTIYSPFTKLKELDISVENDRFKIDKFLFENTAVLELDIDEQKKKLPAIAIEAWLDSAFEPAAAISKEITIGMGQQSIMENKKVDNWMAYFDPFYQATILGNLPAAQKFDSIYVPTSFKNTLQKFDCLGDSALMKSSSLEAFLTKHYPGFKMNPAYDEEQVPTAHSKGYDFIFYLDGNQATFSTLGNIKLSDIATIKILPPIASVTAPSKIASCIIALFTKKGPFWGQDYYRYKYIINGYQPPVYQLPSSPKMFASSPYYLY